MAQTPKHVVEQIGKEYVRRDMGWTSGPSESERELVERAFETMAEINDRLFREIPIPVVFQEEDPYDDYQDMAETVAREQKLRVFSGGDPHPIWDHHAEVTARAVHDWYGHLTLDVDFSPTGEYRKWEHCRNHYPAYCDRVFFTEVVGQLGAVYYLPEGFGDQRFEQKVFPAPTHWIENMAIAVDG